MLLQKQAAAVLADQVAKLYPPGIVGWYRPARSQEGSRVFPLAIQRRARMAFARLHVSNRYDLVIAQIPLSFPGLSPGQGVLTSVDIAEARRERIHETGLLVVFHLVDELNRALPNERAGQNEFYALWGFSEMFENVVRP